MDTWLIQSIKPWKKFWRERCWSNFNQFSISGSNFSKQTKWTFIFWKSLSKPLSYSEARYDAKYRADIYLVRTISKKKLTVLCSVSAKLIQSIMLSKFVCLDVFSYAEDDMVEDPFLAKHLAHFGINIAALEKVGVCSIDKDIVAFYFLFWSNSAHLTD